MLLHSRSNANCQIFPEALQQPVAIREPTAPAAEILKAQPTSDRVEKTKSCKFGNFVVKL